MSEPKFNDIKDIKEWAEKLEFINQLPKEDYEKFRNIYSRILFFDTLFERLDQLHRNLKQASSCYDALKTMIDSGDLARAAELSKSISKIVGEDD